MAQRGEKAREEEGKQKHKSSSHGSSFVAITGRERGLPHNNNKTKQ